MTQVTAGRTLLEEDQPPRQRRRRREGRGGLAILALPAIVWYTIFTVGPLFAMFYMSLLDWRSLVARSSFAGLSNFQEVFADPVFWSATRLSIVQLAVVLPIMLPTAFLIGYYINLKPRGHRILRVVLFTPALISLAAMSVIFLSIFSPTGLVNAVLTGIGLEGATTPWLASSDTAFAMVMIVNLWSGIGFTAILFSARLSGIPGEVFEAAEIDGAGHWRRVWGVAYPICRDYFGVILMLQFIWVLFTSAGTILLLTRGGPGSSSTNLSFLIYDKAFTQAQVGYSQAVGVVLFFVGIIGMLLIRRIFRPTF